jgi:hypothetical protein
MNNLFLLTIYALVDQILLEFELFLICMPLVIINLINQMLHMLVVCGCEVM